MRRQIADTGFIVALNDPDSPDRHWAREQLEHWGTPFLTCEGAIVEASHFLPPALIARMVEDGDFKIVFEVSQQIEPLRRLFEKYSPRMDFTDGCLVRMTELFPDCKVFTVDHDFDFYRRFNNKAIPVEYPPD